MSDLLARALTAFATLIADSAHRAGIHTDTPAPPDPVLGAGYCRIHTIADLARVTP
jgi:hypothetical protein